MSAWTSCRQVMLMLMSYKDTIYYKSKYIIGTNFCASFTERKSFTLHP